MCGEYATVMLRLSVLPLMAAITIIFFGEQFLSICEASRIRLFLHRLFDTPQLPFRRHHEDPSALAQRLP